MTMGEYICGDCGHQFCPECVVFPFGTRKPPLCIACALERGGVRRQSVGRPKLTRKSIKERLALQRQLQSAATPTGDASPATAPAEPWVDETADPADAPGAWREQY